MADALLRTKLAQPHPRPGLVERARLTEVLVRARDAALVLVSAPAGFGKTTLLASRPDTRPSGGLGVAGRPRQGRRPLLGLRRSMPWRERAPGARPPPWHSSRRATGRSRTSWQPW